MTRTLPLGHSDSLSPSQDAVDAQVFLPRLARTFSLLGDVTRLQILQCLKAGPAAVGTIVEACDVKQAAVSKQLRILFDAGLVGRERSGTHIIYSIADPLVFDLCDAVCGRMQDG